MYRESKHNVYNYDLTPFQTGGDEQRGVGCQVKPGFIIHT